MKFPRVQCPVCKRSVALTPKGVVRPHGYRIEPWSGNNGSYCQGTHRRVPLDICSDPRCYSCHLQANRDERTYYNGEWRVAHREYLYERCVEVVEALQGLGPFSISEAWRSDSNRGPESYSMMRNVIRDMVIHGLLVCVKRDRANKCRAYDFAVR